MYMVRHVYCLQVLSLHGCTKVSDEAIAAVALHGSLHSLNVNSIPGIGLSTIKALATATRYASSRLPCGMLGVTVTVPSYWLKGYRCLVHVCVLRCTCQR